MSGERSSKRTAHGEPSLDHFELVEAELPEPRDGEIVVRNTWISVDPYMRGRMDDVPSYIPPFELGVALEGSAVGEVVVSRSDVIPVGATVSHFSAGASTRSSTPHRRRSWTPGSHHPRPTSVRSGRPA